MFGLPEINCVRHASEVVCVSIGANLLLPMAPGILRRFLEDIETDPGKIVQTEFAGVADCLCEKDLKAIGVACQKVEKRKSECACASGRYWRYSEVLSAFIGVFILWSNWIEIPCIAAWCPILLMPAVVAVAWPCLCYNWHLFRLQRAIKKAFRHARKQKRQQNKEREIDNDEYINQFVTNAMNAAGKR